MDERALISILKEQQLEVQNSINNLNSIQREQHSEYLNSLSDPLVKVICGIRRCGKSFFSVYSLPKNSWVYINFDDERFESINPSNLNKIYELMRQINTQAKYYIFDEIQNIKNWDLFINRLKRKGLNIIITGSNGKLLSKEISTHLTGRHSQIEMFPFSFGEYLKYFKVANYELTTTEDIALIKGHFSNYLNEGGFPEIPQLINKRQYLRDLFEKIVLRDILQRYQIRSSTLLKHLTLFLINNVSRELSYKKVQKTFEVGSVNTLKKYVQYLLDCYLFFEVECYSFKIKEQLTKPRKIYCIDTGMYNALQSSFSDNQGLQIENLVFLELKRRRSEIYYYKTHLFEVDFLITENRKIIELIQVCYLVSSEKTYKRELDGLLKAAKLFKCKQLTLVTFENENEITVEGFKIKLIPVWKWLLQNRHT
jgi:predicted AAA+ superfamily ATPase